MSIFLDPRAPAKKEIEGITFHIRVFDSVQRTSFMAHMGPLQQMFEEHAEGDEVGLTDDLIDHLSTILKMGIMGWEGKDAPRPRFDKKTGYLKPKSLGVLDFSVWFQLLAAITETNTLSEEDAGN